MIVSLRSRNIKMKKIKLKKIKIIILSIICLLSLFGCKEKNSIDNNETIEIENSLKEYDYSFNPHVISEEYLSVYGNDIKDIFFGFCDVLLVKEKQFRCESNERFYQLLSISNSCFPLANQIIDKDKTYVSDGVCYLVYNYPDDILDVKIDEFIQKVTDVIKEAVRYETLDYIKAIELYSAVARKNSYDYDYTLDDALKIRTYRPIMENIGICQEIAKEYIYYLLQVGVDAISCSAINNDKSDAHEWVLIKLDDRYYHVDPTYALNYPDSLFFFAMDDRQREYYGDFDMNQFTYADTDILKHDDFKADDRRFMKLWLAKSYNIDYNNEIITLIDNNTLKEYEYHFDE